MPRLRWPRRARAPTRALFVRSDSTLPSPARIGRARRWLGRSRAAMPGLQARVARARGSRTCASWSTLFLQLRQRVAITARPAQRATELLGSTKVRLAPVIHAAHGHHQIEDLTLRRCERRAHGLHVGAER